MSDRSDQEILSYAVSDVAPFREDPDAIFKKVTGCL